MNEILFIFQRINWLSVLDLVLVTLIFFTILTLLRDTQATILLRGVIFLVILLALLTQFIELPAFSWLIQTTLPALLLAIPVIFAPEIRRGLERLGRAGSSNLFRRNLASDEAIKNTMHIISIACARLSARRHGALIVLERIDSLQEYVQTGVYMDAVVSPELLLQIFYPNSPLHDGAVVISGNRILAASCVMPLSASGILNRTPERQMGLRHRAALGSSEASDAVVIVVSEETGSISVAQSGRLIRGLDSDRLENMLIALFRPVPGIVDYINIFGWKIRIPGLHHKEED
ncbi:MAG: TIGR00159 family protein [Chloroflexi bacterium HGW-Chloroflexi-3]|nr:MAG: TIGR00159 family protein [Chloroflexi bacterium HGW-Chloroflexi-3]